LRSDERTDARLVQQLRHERADVADDPSLTV
jgi:hypothetical protein